MPRRILGIDPGLGITGYGVIEGEGMRPRVVEAGVIRGGKGDLAARLDTLFVGITEVIEQFLPEAVAVEALYAHYKHPRTAILMGHARGVLLLAAMRKNVAVVSYAATRIKKIITGNGHASKDQIQRTIQGELGLATLPEPPDVADALAAALCHWHLAK